MAANKPPQTLADYVTMALSAVLIMALIGSLVFFLQEVFYGGDQFSGRLNWTFFWFIFGIVLVARIAMHPAVGQRAKLYGIVLSIVVWFGLQKFLSFELLMNFMRRFANKEQTADDQNNVTARDRQFEHVEQRLLKPDHPRKRHQQQNARDHRQCQARAARFGLFVSG